MFKMCKTSQSSQRQRLIADNLLSLMQTKSFSDITVSELCEKSAIPRKTFYRYFDCKDDVFECLIALVCWDYETYRKDSNSSGPRTSLADMENIFSYWLLHRDLMTAIQKNQKSTLFVHQLVSTVLIEKAGLRFFNAKEDELQKSAVLFSMTGLCSLLYTWADDNFTKSPEEMAGIAVALMTQPLVQKM